MLIASTSPVLCFIAVNMVLALTTMARTLYALGNPGARMINISS